MTNLPIIQDKPLEKPPEDELERLAFKTLCKDCEFLTKKKHHRKNFVGGVYSYKVHLCKNPYNGQVDILTGLSNEEVQDLNPSGYGCPTFKSKKTGKMIKVKKAGWLTFYILAIWGLIDIFMLLF